MRGSAFALLLAVCSACGAQSGNTPASLLHVTGSGNCPIAIEAHQQSHVSYLLASSSARFHPSFEIILRSSDDRAIQQVVLDLTGPRGPGFRDASNSTGAKYPVETFTLTGLGGTVETSRMTAVQSLSLVSVTYVDGSRWHRSSTNVCTVAPNGFVPIQ